MGQLICVMNQKGGVGKTTTVINLGACLARAGYQTLVVDLDPQCNATSGLDRKPLSQHPFVSDQALGNFIVSTDWPKFFLLPGTKNLGDVSALNQGGVDVVMKMKEAFQTGLNSFDYVLIDSPPAVSPLTRTALDCASQVLMPIQCEFFAMEGISKMAQLLPGDKWQSTGILLTMVDLTLELTREVESEVREYFGDIVFKTRIPRDVAIAEASSFGKPVTEYSPRSRGARAYLELCMEVLENEQE